MSTINWQVVFNSVVVVALAGMGVALVFQAVPVTNVPIVAGIAGSLAGVLTGQVVQKAVAP